MVLTSSPDLAGIARLVADQSRAAMLLALLDGRAWTASELAGAAQISRSTATGHLDQLVAAGLLDQVRQGRHRYLRIASPAVAEAIEALAALSARVRPAPATLRAQRADQAVREARSCYRHLAGRLGVAVCDAALAAGFVSPDWQLTDSGRAWLASLQVPLDRLAAGPLIKPCLDWTERREHLAGRAAEALLAALLERSWLERGPVPRAVRLTPAGHAGLDGLLNRASA